MNIILHEKVAGIPVISILRATAEDLDIIARLLPHLKEFIQVPVKRKRGRPRKYPLPENQ